MKVGVIGFGKMGAAICSRLIERGTPLACWDISDAAMKAAGEANVPVAEGPRALAACSDVIITIVPNDAAVRGLFDDGALFGVDVNGKLFIEMSTLQPATGQSVAPLARARGARMLEAPVIGSVPHAATGRLIALTGGNKADIDFARGILELLTERIVYLGADGSGYAGKLCVNLCLGAYAQAVAEALVLGVASGLSRSQVMEVLAFGPTATPWLANKRAGILSGEGEVSLDLRTMRKDLASMIAAAARGSVSLPMTAATLGSFTEADGAGRGDDDLTAICAFALANAGRTSIC